MSLLVLFGSDGGSPLVFTGIVDFTLESTPLFTLPSLPELKLRGLPPFTLASLPGLIMRALPTFVIPKLEQGFPLFITDISGVWLQDVNSAGLHVTAHITGEAEKLPAVPAFKVDE